MSFRFKPLSFLSFLALSTVVHAASSCNGSPDLCSKSYNALTYIGAHDSYAIGPTTNVFVNQDQSITTQLNDGIRLLQMQAHNNENTITLCHSGCNYLNGGTLESYLKTVKSWMDSNTDQVLTLLIVNINNIPAAKYAEVFASVGLDKLSYAPSSTSGTWPTLGALIDANTRLITFLDNQASAAEAPYLLDEFTNIWETKYNVVNPVNFDCEPDRGSGAPMSMINHFYNQLIFNQPAPWPQRANVTNGKGGEPESLGKHVDVCKAKLGKAPNFILLDYYEFAGTTPFEIAAEANGIAYSGKAIATPSSTASGPGTSNGGSTNASGNGNGNSNGATRAVSGMFGVAAALFGIGVVAI